MELWEAIVLGVVQGLTEFFPVSSSGHLVMTQDVLGLKIPGILFEVVVHVATLISVLIVYRGKLWKLVRGCCGLEEESAWPYVGKIIVATIPAGIIGVTLEDWFDAQFESPVIAGTMLLVTGAIVWSSRWTREPRRALPLDWVPLLIAAAFAVFARSIVPFVAMLAVEFVILVIARITAPREWHTEPTWSGAVVMGVAQAAAIMPGISRSGSTVIAGMWRRIEPVAAAEFSFLMSIPAILGAAVLKLRDVGGEEAVVGAVPLLAGGIAAGVCGVLAIRLFVALLRRQNFHVFAYYCWAAAALFLLVPR